MHTLSHQLTHILFVTKHCMLSSENFTQTRFAWFVTFCNPVTWHMTPDTWHLTLEKLQMTSDTWHFFDIINFRENLLCWFYSSHTLRDSVSLYTVLMFCCCKMQCKANNLFKCIVLWNCNMANWFCGTKFMKQRIVNSISLSRARRKDKHFYQRFDTFASNWWLLKSFVPTVYNLRIIRKVLISLAFQIIPVLNMQI